MRFWKTSKRQCSEHAVLRCNFGEEGDLVSMALRFDKVQLISVRDKLGERSSSNESKYERIVGAYNHRAN